MRTLSLLVIALALPLAAEAQLPMPQPGQPIALNVGSIDDGTTVHSPGTLVVAKGKIVAIGVTGKVKLPENTYQLPAAPQIKQVLDQLHIKPMLIDANSQRGADGALGEAAFRFTPGFSAADAFDPFAAGFRQAARGGVAHFVFAPDVNAVLSGKAILLSTGEKHLGVALRREVALFGSIDPDAYLTTEYPPNSRSEAITHLEGLFAKAKKGDLGTNGDHRTWRPDATALRAVLDRKLPLALRVRSAGDVLVALGLFKKLGARGILIGGNRELHKVVAQVKAAKVGVVLDPFSPRQTERTLSLPAVLAKAGVTFAFSSRAPQTLESGLLDQAALAVLHGLDPAVAFRAVTTAPVELYGLPSGGTLRVGGPVSLLVFRGGSKFSFSSRLAAVQNGPINFSQLMNQLMRR